VRRPVHRSSYGLSIAVALLAPMLAACGSSGSSGSGQTSAPATSVAATSVTSTAPTAPALQYLAFGDSWPEGAHCSGCRTFVERWGDALARQTGAAVELTDMTGERERSAADGKQSTSLRSAVETDAATRDAIAAADVVLIASGPNEMESAAEASRAGTCGGDDDADCIRALGARWAENFDAILSEIATLRAGKPTAVRLVNAANPFLSEPSMVEGMPDGFATGNGALIFEELTRAICDAAKAHPGAVCVDIRPALNGPSLDQPVDENSDASMQAVADLLAKTGVDELG